MLSLLLLLSQAAAPDPLLGTHRGQWGIFVQNIATGEVLLDRCGACLYTPASVTKLFTTALALTRFGPQHRFTTEVRQEGDDLVLVGGGDPSLSGRVYPYAPGQANGDPLSPIDILAGAIAARGIREVKGDIIGDDTLWEWRIPPDGWSHDDFTWDYGAPVSALAFNDNVFQITLRPGAKPGDLARLTLNPALEYYTLDNRVETTANGARQLRVLRETGSRQLQWIGTLPLADRGRTEWLAIDDPALYAALALRDALVRQGVVVRGQARAVHRRPGDGGPRAKGGTVVATRTSPPLAELAKVVNKISQNLHAEMLLEASGGAAVLDGFLRESGIAKPDYRFVDGSGLSRLDLVTPRALVRLLATMGRNQAFVETLPVAATDGSLQYRYRGTAGAGQVRAKTGGMTGVQTLAGYIDTKSGQRLAFAILVNGDNGPGAQTRALMDRLVLGFVNGNGTLKSE